MYIQNLSYPLYRLGCHQLPKRGRLKVSRPLKIVLVINDNMVYGTNVIIECLKRFSPGDAYNNMEMHAKGQHEDQYGSKTRYK